MRTKAKPKPTESQKLAAQIAKKPPPPVHKYTGSLVCLCRTQKFKVWCDIRQPLSCDGRIMSGMFWHWPYSN